IEIEPDGFSATSCQREGDVTGSTAEVQRPPAGIDSRHFDHTPFPEPVQAETLNIIQQVVAACDPGKQPVYLRHALGTWIIEFVRHSSPGPAARLIRRILREPPAGPQSNPPN